MGGYGSGRQGGRPTVESAWRFDIDALVRAGAIKPGAYVEGSLNLPSYDDELAIEFEVVGHQSPKQLASAAICHSRLLDRRTTPNRRQNLSHRVAPVVRRPAVVVRLPKRKPTGAQALSAARRAPISITRRLSACLCFAARNRPRQGHAAGTTSSAGGSAMIRWMATILRSRRGCGGRRTIDY